MKNSVVVAKADDQSLRNTIVNATAHTHQRRADIKCAASCFREIDEGACPERRRARTGILERGAKWPVP